MAVRGAASVSVDFSQAQVEKKVASCTPRIRLEAIHFPHKARGKRKENSETPVLPGAAQTTLAFQPENTASSFRHYNT